MSLIYLTAAVFALSSFFIASAQDFRSREVDDILWIVSGTAGIAISVYLLTSAVSGVLLPALTATFPAFLFADMFIDWNSLSVKFGPTARYATGGLCALLTLVAVYRYSGIVMVDAVAASSLWILFIFLLFHLDVIKGGADAKALVCLTLLFPLYPQPVLGHILPEYISFTFPFFINTLLLGALFSLSVPVFLFIMNASRGDAALPMMFLGYRKKPEDVMIEKEWLMEYPAEDGTPARLRKLGSSDDENMLKMVKSSGWKTVWVSPKIPFIVPLSIGLVFTLLFGNILLYV